MNLNVNYRTTVSLDEINYGECFELNGYHYMPFISLINIESFISKSSNLLNIKEFL